MNDRQTIAGAYAEIEGHERLCAERYDNIRTSISDIKSWLKWGVAMLVSLALSLMGFMGHQLIQGNNDRMSAIEHRGHP